MKTKVKSPGQVKVGNILSFVPKCKDPKFPIWKGLPLYKPDPIESFGIDLVHRTNQPFKGLVLAKNLLASLNGREPAIQRFVIKLLIDGQIRFIFSQNLVDDNSYTFFILTHD